jgi:hypothetical protein
MAVREVWCRVTVFGPDGSVLLCWTLGGWAAPDLAVIDQMARLRLEVGRRGGSVTVSDVSTAFGELLELVGLGRLTGQMNGQTEDREQPVGLEERVDRADSPG